MQAVRFRIPLVLVGWASVAACWAASFGTVVPVNGTVSDIALDERRNVVWAANLSAYRVEQVDIASKSLLTPLTVPMPPSAVAISPNHRFLLVGEYQQPDPAELSANPFAPGTGGYTLFDLDANLRYDVNLNSPVLAVAFGADNNAVILTRIPVPADPTNPGPLTNVFALQPFPVPTLIPITSFQIDSKDLPVALATFPTQISEAAVGVSGDGNKIVILAAPSGAKAGAFAEIRYDVPTETATLGIGSSSPLLGPRSVSVDQDATNVLEGWFMLLRNQTGDHISAAFPRPNGAFQIGSHAWDLTRNLIYAQIPVPEDKSVLHIVDTDNLTVRQRIQLSEDLSGKSQMSLDGQFMYSASVSGVTILPIGQLPNTAQVGATQLVNGLPQPAEDVVFAADACNRMVVTQTITIASLSSVQTDFTLSLPDGVNGVTLSATSGTTPAQVLITIDPTVFQGVKGTTSIPLTITSTGAVNLPPALRLLINTQDFNQRGTIQNIPGKLVDLLADPLRSLLYVLRQDKNLVLAYDMTALENQSLPGTPVPVFTLRTGNTPTQMAMTTDQKYLIVGNDNSQLANVFDLDARAATDPIFFPGGHSPRSIGVANTGIFASVRLQTDPPTCVPVLSATVAILDHVDFGGRTADTPCTLSAGANRAIYQNVLTSADGVLASSPAHDYLLLALPDGNVLEYADSAQTWVASRQDLTSLGGAYGAFSGNLFLVGPNLLDGGLVPLGDPFPATDGTSSGVATLNGVGLRTTATSASDPGLIQRINLTSLKEFNATPMAEAPVTSDSLTTPPVGQIGETILPFARSLAVSPDQTRVFALTISGLTVLNSNFDAVLAKPVISSVTNAADGSSSVAVGGVADINGSALATMAVSAGAPPLPSSLGQVCALVNNIALPLFSVSPSQIVAQLPYTSGPASLVVHTAGGISDPFAFTIQAQAPAIFQTNGIVQVTGCPVDDVICVVRDDNNQPVDFTNPIHPNTELTIYVTGLGLTNPQPDLGTVAPSSPPAVVTNPPTVTLGTVSLPIISATLVPGQIGVYQIKVKAPSRVQVSRSTPLTVSAGGVSATYNVRVVSP